MVDATGPASPDPRDADEGSGAGDHGDASGTDASGTDRGPERLVQEGLDHLQRAARETIAAVRVLLDLAEELVEDPTAAQHLVGTIGSLAQAATRLGGPAPWMKAHADSAAGRPEDGDDGGRVQRIPVS